MPSTTVLPLLLLFLVGTRAYVCLPKNTTSLLMECRLFDSYQRNFGCFPDATSGPQRGIVLPQLGANFLPIFNPAARNSHNCLTDANDFNPWFNRSNGTLYNATMPYNSLCDCYRDEQFYPHPNPSVQARYHHFACYSKLCLVYERGQFLNVHSDGNLWIYLDRRLVVDLGGVHEDMNVTLRLDTISMRVGTVHRLRFYLAQQYKNSCNFSFAGKLCLVECPRDEIVEGGAPTQQPTRRPTMAPTARPTKLITASPTSQPTKPPPRTRHG